MVTMVDEIFDRHYQASRDELNGTIVAGARHLGEAIANAFRVLNRIEYSAPWVGAQRARTH